MALQERAVAAQDRQLASPYVPRQMKVGALADPLLFCCALEVQSALPLPGALDWPLSKDEKRLCAMKLFQQEVEASCGDASSSL